MAVYENTFYFASGNLGSEIRKFFQPDLILINRENWSDLDAIIFD
jgi:hypothetical protein